MYWQHNLRIKHIGISRSPFRRTTLAQYQAVFARKPRRSTREQSPSFIGIPKQHIVYLFASNEIESLNEEDCGDGTTCIVDYRRANYYATAELKRIEKQIKNQLARMSGNEYLSLQ